MTFHKSDNFFAAESSASTVAGGPQTSVVYIAVVELQRGDADRLDPSGERAVVGATFRSKLRLSEPLTEKSDSA